MAGNVAVLKGYAEQAEWHPVSSSNVVAVGYLAGYKYVFVRFGAQSKVKSLYVYHVPDDAEAIFRGILAAPSKGKAVNGLLKANYSYDRLE